MQRILNNNCLILDIDGVLIDTSESYNKVIKKTVEFILDLKYIHLPEFVDDDLITRFRQTGGFNNDIDTSYAIILLSMLSNKKNIHDIKHFILNTLEKLDNRGILALEEILSKNLGLKEIKKILNYPSSNRGESLVETVFNEIFYGKDLFYRIYERNPEYYNERAFIENDKVIIKESTLDYIKRVFNDKIAIASGRSKLAAIYSLRRVLPWINISSSIFLEDEVREYAKPNPYALSRIMKMMNVNIAYYVGDSMEDLLMVERARQNKLEVNFIGVYGSSPNPAKTKELFINNSVTFLIDNINEIPNIFNKVT